MEDNSSSDNPRKAKEPGKSASKKAKGTKDPNRRIADLANKYSKLSRQLYPYEDIMKKASFAYDLERQMRGTHDVMRIMEESTRISEHINSLTRIDLPEMLGITSIGEAARSAYERINKIFENPLKDIFEHINSHQNILRNSFYFKPLKDIFGNISTVQSKWMDALKINPLENVLKEIEGIHHMNLKDIFKISSEMKEFYANLPADEIIVQEDQSVVCAGKAYEISDIEKALREKLENSGFLTDSEIGKKNFDALLSGLEKIGDPSLKSIIYYFLVSMFVSIIMVFVTPHLENMQKRIFSKNKATVTKLIEREVPKTIPDKDSLYYLRFVTADVLHVRSRNYQRSDLIGKLYFGSVVRVIQKNKNWTLIEWKDQDNDLVIQGWVFSRYLKKFRI